MACELSAIIRDNPVWYAEYDHDVLEELFGLLGCDFGYRFGFNPFGELVDGGEEVCETTWCYLQGSDHVESPGNERPGAQNGL